MMKRHPIKSFMQISTLIMFKYLVYVCCQNRERQYNEALFKLADSSNSFSSEDILYVRNTSKYPRCVTHCLQHTRCVGVRFAPSTGQCHMYAAYQTTTGTGTTGDKYYIMEGGCGSLNPSQSFVYWREDGLAAKAVCNGTQAFLGINTTVWCFPTSQTWTPAPGKCVSTTPLLVSGKYIHALDSGLSFVGTPTENVFSIFFATANGDYALKIKVLIDQLTVARKCRFASNWQESESDLMFPFPFEMAKKFTMDIVSTATEFQCKVNGAMLFTFQHRLPRDSVDIIRIFAGVNFEKVLLI
ncbi:uncharacterized protein [Haliotis cracherodii]|uniref:uncharacterized protein n=1 Tax=Haliotis cracherodii TaxID=6455 RepID=UPI0039EBBDED